MYIYILQWATVHFFVFLSSKKQRNRLFQCVLELLVALFHPVLVFDGCVLFWAVMTASYVLLLGFINCARHTLFPSKFSPILPVCPTVFPTMPLRTWETREPCLKHTIGKSWYFLSNLSRLIGSSFTFVSECGFLRHPIVWYKVVNPRFFVPVSCLLCLFIWWLQKKKSLKHLVKLKQTCHSNL